MSNLSELLPTGGGQNAVDFVASGTLSSGQTVALKTDGTVEAVSASANPSVVGSAVVFDTSTTSYIASAFDSNLNKVVIAYRDENNSNYGTAIVGTVSGTTISFGSAVVFNASDAREIGITFDSNENKIVIVYRDNGNSGYGTAIVGTVSGTSISFGSEVVFESAITLRCTAVFDTVNNKVLIAYRDFGNSNYGTAIVGTVSGTSISFGSRVYFNNAASGGNAMTFDSNSNKMVISFADSANGSKGTSVVGTVSGTSISFGSEAIFNNAATKNLSSTFDSVNNKIIISYKDSGDNNEGKAVVGTVSGTSISFGSEAEWMSSGTFYGDENRDMIAFDPNANKVVIAYNDETDSFDGEFVVGTVSGTNISFSSSTDFDTDSNESTALVFDSNVNKFALAFRDSGNSNRGTVRSLQLAYSNTTNTLTSENYIGIASGGTYADTAEATIDVVGTVNKDQSGLTAGQTYYVQNDGTLGTSADSPSVVAGTAISATELIVKG